MKIKICGNLYPEESHFVASCQPEYMGWIFAPSSPRRISIPSATQIINEIRQSSNQIAHVAVFAENSIQEILEIISSGPHFDFLQVVEGSGFIHDLRHQLGERGNTIVPALRVREPVDESTAARFGTVPFFICDSFVPGKQGGTGKVLESRFLAAFERPYLLAGGLNAENIGSILSDYSGYPPLGVDVSSGLEDAPGRKNRQKVNDFIRIVREFTR